MVEWQTKGGLETADGGQRWNKKELSQPWSGGSERNDDPVRKTVGPAWSRSGHPKNVPRTVGIPTRLANVTGAFRTRCFLLGSEKCCYRTVESMGRHGSRTIKVNLVSPALECYHFASLPDH
jgi:hypothetical protein